MKMTYAHICRTRYPTGQYKTIESVAKVSLFKRISHKQTAAVGVKIYEVG